jgi:AcrR family transcriptional regulator
VARTLDPVVHMVRKEAFVDAAQRLMQTKGYEQMSVQDLLDELGASRGAFYHYFDSKQALLEAVIDRMVDAGLGAVAPVVDDPNLPATTKLQRVFSGIGQWKTDRKALVMSLIEVWLSDHNAIVREKLRRTTADRMVPLLARIVEQGVDEGTFDVSSPSETARVLVMLLQGFQDGATELFVARQKRLISYEEVERTMATYAEAFDRILGVQVGGIIFADRAILREWFG